MDYAKTRRPEAALQLQPWSWADADDILSDDDIALLTMPLDQVSSRRNARVSVFEPRQQADEMLLAQVA